MKAAGSIRTALLLKNIKIGFWFRLGSQGLNFVMVPVLLKMLGSANYGLWVLIASIVGWSSFFDLGISSGLRNKFATAVAAGDLTAARAYVSSAYFLIALIVVALMVVAGAGVWLMNWNGILNAGGIQNNVLRPVISIVLAGVGLKLVLNLVSTLLTANQEAYWADGINFGTNLLAFSGIMILSKYSADSLMNVSLVLSGTPILVLVICTVVFFIFRFRQFIPSTSQVSFRVCRDLATVGSRFLAIQIAGIIIFSTDSLIITQLFGPDEVANYHLAFKYFGLITIGFAIISNPMWSAYTAAFTLGDYSWIRETTGKLQTIWLLFSGATFALFLVSNKVYDFWIGTEVEISGMLSASMAFYVTVYTWGSIFVNFINGVGKIKLQVIFSVIAGIVNIPLSVLLAKFTFLGPSGVILATTICLSYGPLVSYYQYQKILNNTATGIWNQ